MTLEVRICSKCGAGVVGKMFTCAEADCPLRDAAPAENQAAADSNDEDDYDLVILPGMDDEPLQTEHGIVDMVGWADPDDPTSVIQTSEVPQLNQADLDQTADDNVDFAVYVDDEQNQGDEGDTEETSEGDTEEYEVIPEAPPASDHLDDVDDELSFEEAHTAALNPNLLGASASLLSTAPGKPQQPQTPPTPIPSSPTPPVQSNAGAALVPAGALTGSEIFVPSVQQIPPAPYTPPPLREMTASLHPYSFPSNHYLEQRVSSYRQGGYDLISHSPYQVTLAYGKPIGFLWWIVALLSVVGFLWYLLILLSSGFTRDRAYLIVERDGTLYEDGPGSAHVRKARSNIGRRWGFLGVVIFFTALVWFSAMVLIGAWGINNYRAELEAAYPTVSLFAGADPAANLNPAHVETAESAVIAYSISFVLSVVAFFGGLALTIIGYLHSSAYNVRVVPLPS